jgi:diguanylate cyclase (GGDEF)-like protein
MSVERAIAELFEYAGRQFDPDLVKQLSSLGLVQQSGVQRRVANRWLVELDSFEANRRWNFTSTSAEAEAGDGKVEELVQRHLFDFNNDAVVWIDGHLQIRRWNESATRLTGLFSESVYQCRFTPQLLDLCDAAGKTIQDQDCPVVISVKTKTRFNQRWYLTSRSGRRVPVDAQVIPITASDGTGHGVILIMRDASGEASLVQRIESLHERVALDNLTQVANRAEFDRVHAEMVDSHLANDNPYSLVISDIDHFKKINDTFGHQMGDQALQRFARVLKQMIRRGDLVARYGGEEFVILCPGCEIATATQRAEAIRAELSSLKHEDLGGRPITASFGVTELQPGDTADTMLRRADRALLKAKESGRNTVIQIGGGCGHVDSARTLSSRVRSLFGRLIQSRVIDTTLITAVPLDMALEKLRGFVADHMATVESVDGNRIIIGVQDLRTPYDANAQPVAPMNLQIDFSEERDRVVSFGSRKALAPRTRLHVLVHARTVSDRRRRETEIQARRVLASLRAYLMATADTSSEQAVPWGELGPI